ncbi:MAG: nitroreductase [Pseudomonadota bacterium]
MDLAQAMQERYSVRAFLDKPVEKSLIDEILTLAVRGPSWGNTQPWEIVVAGGDTVRKMTAEFVQRVSAGDTGHPDFTMPEKFVDDYMTRYRALGVEIFRIKGIGREDKQARTDHSLNASKGFGAPNLIYLILDQRLETVYPIFDCGILAAYICLGATARGLGTCLMAVLTRFPDITRRYLKLGPEKKVVLGMALGYPKKDEPINQMRTPRDPLEKNVTWVDLG